MFHFNRTIIRHIGNIQPATTAYKNSNNNNNNRTQNIDGEVKRERERAREKFSTSQNCTTIFFSLLFFISYFHILLIDADRLIDHSDSIHIAYSTTICNLPMANYCSYARYTQHSATMYGTSTHFGTSFLQQNSIQFNGHAIT